MNKDKKVFKTKALVDSIERAKLVPSDDFTDSVWNQFKTYPQLWTN